MIKKKLNIYLLLLLVVLFISLLGTISYASNYTLTNDDIDKVVDYYVIASRREEYKTKLHAKLGAVYENYNTCVIGVDRSTQAGDIGIYLYGFNREYVTSVSNPKNTNYMSVSMTNGQTHMCTGWYYDYQGSHNYFSANLTGGISFGTGAQLRTNYLCVPCDLGDNLFIGPWESIEIIFSDYFIYAPSSLIDEIDLNNTYYFSDTAQVINFVRDMERKHK